ncbi:MAG: DUF4837 family protein [Bacteroidales bacterium]|nr:DUF4837 family protein [Bacteroidales bacterium]MCF8403529.1 DUF4837 family protein [Bacteroidales bacterium]
MKKIVFVIPLITLFFLSSCTDKKAGPARSSGKTAEMIVATNGDETWEGPVGEAIRNFFNQDYEVLSQQEPLFTMAHLPESKLVDNKMLRAHHNIFIVNIDPKFTANNIDARKDVWAGPQRVIKITSPDVESFLAYFDEKKEIILGILMDSEYERLIKTFRSFRDREIFDQVIKNFGFSLEIPSGFYVAKKQADFMWIRKETQHNSQGVIIYTYDFVDTLAFDQARILSFRDVMTEEFIPGPSEGSYMTIAREYSPLYSKPIEFKGMYAIETRGLWRLEGDFMGGPFVNYTFVDERINKVVTIDGYVYAPNKPKRDLMIQMESIARSLKFVE